MKPALLLLLNLFFVAPSFAQGTQGGGGGDADVEARIDDIRADLVGWILQGGAADLKLPARISRKEYEKKMLGILAPKKVIVNAITQKEQDFSDSEKNTYIDGKPKTCKGFYGRKDRLPHILCSFERFNQMLDDKQYRQIHHEYAGLVEIEKNEGAASDYEISNQVAAELVAVTVVRLGVKDKPHSILRLSPSTGEEFLMKALRTGSVECKVGDNETIVKVGVDKKTNILQVSTSRLQGDLTLSDVTMSDQITGHITSKLKGQKQLTFVIPTIDLFLIARSESQVLVFDSSGRYLEIIPAICVLTGN